MVSQSKLIKKGINYTDALFEEIINRLQNGVNSSDTLEEFLVNNQEYTSANPLVSTGYQDTMINLVLSETNNHRFSRPSQRELTRVTISEQLGTLISNVGEEVKQTIRDIVTEEYGRGSNPQKMAKRFSTELGGINKRRARVIARTEIARTSTISDYIISKEQGATHYTVGCRSTRCQYCKDLYCNTSETGGDVEFSIDDTEHLPPLHPNCRCVADFYKKKGPVKEEPENWEFDGYEISKNERKEYTNLQIKELKGQSLTPKELERKEILQAKEQFGVLNKRLLLTGELGADLEAYKKYYNVLKKQTKTLKSKVTKPKTQKPKQSKKSDKIHFKSDEIFPKSYTSLENEVKIGKDLEKWGNKRLKNKIEYGHYFDRKTGELIGDEIKGSKHGANLGKVIPKEVKNNPNIATMHTHYEGGLASPSKQDLIIARCQPTEHNLSMSPNEIWDVISTDNFGTFGQFSQVDVDAAFDECYKKAFAKVKDGMEKGIISTTNEKEMLAHLDKELGDELLKEFNSPKWEGKLRLIREYR